MIPMTPSDYRFAFDGIAKADEYHRVQRLIDSGHEFAVLMEAGGTVRIGGEWREIATIDPEPGHRVTIVCTDRSEWLARNTATRPYRPAETGEAS